MTLARLPISVFSITMGVGGLALVWRDAGHLLNAPAMIGESLIGLTIGLFLMLLALTLVRFAQAPKRFLRDAQTPDSMNFITTPTITLLLISAGLAPRSAELGEAIWLAAAIGNLGLSVFVLMFCWLPQRLDIAQITPAWYVPLVANAVIPITGAQYGYDLFNWMVLGASGFFFLALTPPILLRLFAHEALPETLKPTIFIFLAPPSLCFSAYVALNSGYVDETARLIFGVAAFMGAMVAVRAGHILVHRFSMYCWAMTFPVAAFAGAFMHLHWFEGVLATQIAAIAALGLVTAIVSLVFFQSIRAALRGALY